MSKAAFIVIFVNIMLSEVVNGRLVDSDYHQKPVPELVVRCRADCLEKFLYTSNYEINPIEDCQEQSNCSMCWDFCQFLHLEKRDIIKSMCTDHTCVSIHFSDYCFL